MPFDSTLLGNGCPACDDDGGKCDTCGCVGDGKPWPTAMEKAERACFNFEITLGAPCLTHVALGISMLNLCRAMLAAMREHNEMMRAKK